MLTDLIVVSPAVLDYDSSLLATAKPLRAQPLAAKHVVENPVARILLSLARVDVSGVDVGGRQPLQDCPGDELRSVVRTHIASLLLSVVAAPFRSVAYPLFHRRIADFLRKYPKRGDRPASRPRAQRGRRRRRQRQRQRAMHCPRDYEPLYPHHILATQTSGALRPQRCQHPWSGTFARPDAAASRSE